MFNRHGKQDTMQIKGRYYKGDSCGCRYKRRKGDIVREYCTDCGGKGYHASCEQDDNFGQIIVRLTCKSCQGLGYVYKHKERNALERIASLLTNYDIDEDICKKISISRRSKCSNEGIDRHDCIDCIIDFFSKPCKWEQDEVCVNDKSEWRADFVDNRKCGSCRYYK